MNGTGKEEDGVMQLNSVFRSIKCVTFKDEVKALKLKKDFMMSVRNGLLNMTSRGLLSKTGMPKRVISVDTIEYAIKK
ncbi:hypothetical protein [Absidia glauca]|uniref:Uncharacterized protein n=1 Tax=Absidia glauca TaxID=4829 RepID=A0A163JYE8_ABSGL|nr:hypothetical protein [Absidia glauca]